MPDFIAKPEDSSHLLTEQAQQYSTADKLRMEADLLSSGIRQGFMNRAQDAWDNKAATALEFGTAAIIGGALTAMHQAGGRWGVAAKFATYGLIGVAVGDVASRVARRRWQCTIPGMIQANSKQTNQLLQTASAPPSLIIR